MNAALHASKVLLGLEFPQSQVSDDEMTCLLSYANHADVVVEIGCYEGKTSAMLAGRTTGKVYSIDPFFKGRVGICYSELIAKVERRRQGLKNIEFIKAFSHEAAPQFTKPIDLLFIDADHSYDAVKRDWEDWFPKVRKGGIVALHDSRPAPNSPERLGSMKFYEEYIPTVSNVKEVDAVGSMVVLRVMT
jgi:predicted O-methyltransferase YrrM